MGDFIDQLARAMARGTSRKDFLKLIGAAALGVFAADPRDVEAKKGGKSKGKGKKGTCTSPAECGGNDCCAGKCCAQFELCATAIPNNICCPLSTPIVCETEGGPSQCCEDRDHCLVDGCCPDAKLCIQAGLVLGGPPLTLCCNDQETCIGPAGDRVCCKTDQVCTSSSGKSTCCPPGQSCKAGECVGPPLVCSNCIDSLLGTRRCCFSGNCKDSSGLTCGRNGEPCDNCNVKSQICVDGACQPMPPAPCTTLGGICTPTAVDCAQYGSSACDTGTCADFGTAPSPGQPNPPTGCCPQEKFSPGPNGIFPGLCCGPSLFPVPNLGAACAPK